MPMNERERTRRIGEIASEALAIFGAGRQVASYASRYAGFDLTEAYEVVDRVRDMRAARGETAIGRKIGFTNRAVQITYGVHGPIWNYMFDSTVRDLAAIDCRFDLSGLTEPRIEPEIVFHLSAPPRPEMGAEELLGCIDWAAHGFEIVQSIFPNWTFTAADSVAAYGLHGAFLLGAKHAIDDTPGVWAHALSSFTVELASDDGVNRRGHATNVLGGPLEALRFLVRQLAASPAGAPLRPGELVTTGTLTDAMPVVAGQTWSTRLSGVPLEGLRVRFE
jgi:2-oxo-3-hexenedioate decarboxylase